MKFPANVDFFLQILVAAKDFEFLKIGDILEDKLLNFPEEDPISLGAQMSGVMSTFSAENLGTAQWLAYLVVLLIIMRKVNICCCLTERLIGSANWSGSIRFFVEAYFDFVMVFSINLKYVEQETNYPSVKYSNVLSILLLVVTVLMSIFIPVFYWYKRKSWEEATF